MSDMDYQSWRCTSRDTFTGLSGKSVFCPPEGCSKEDGCALDKQEADDLRAALNKKENDNG